MTWRRSPGRLSIDPLDLRGPTGRVGWVGVGGRVPGGGAPEDRAVMSPIGVPRDASNMATRGGLRDDRRSGISPQPPVHHRPYRERDTSNCLSSIAKNYLCLFTSI